MREELMKDGGINLIISDKEYQAEGRRQENLWRQAKRWIKKNDPQLWSQMQSDKPTKPKKGRK